MRATVDFSGRFSSYAVVFYGADKTFIAIFRKSYFQTSVFFFMHQAMPYGIFGKGLDQHGRDLDFIRINGVIACNVVPERSEEHTSELQSLMRISYAVFCLKKKNIIYNKSFTHLPTYNSTLQSILTLLIQHK